MRDADWERLLRRIQTGRCTPFLGAGVGFGALPLGGAIAREWADRYEYPLDDRDDLARVAQFVAVIEDPIWPKEEIRVFFEERPSSQGKTSRTVCSPNCRSRS